MFVEGNYSNAAGSRAYRLFIPSAYHGRAIPLVIMLHGPRSRRRILPPARA
jgi:poly(3-hydroxybutyrate) depolymerase